MHPSVPDPDPERPFKAHYTVGGRGVHESKPVWTGFAYFTSVIESSDALDPVKLETASDLDTHRLFLHESKILVKKEVDGEDVVGGIQKAGAAVASNPLLQQYAGEGHVSDEIEEEENKTDDTWTDLKSETLDVVGEDARHEYSGDPTDDDGILDAIRLYEDRLYQDRIFHCQICMSCFSHLAPYSVLSPSLSSYTSAPASIYPKQEPLKQTPTPRPDHMLAHDTANTTNVETFYGYVKNRLDALLLIEACIAGSLYPLNVIPADLSQMNIRSGTVLVFAENNHHSMMVRWRDGERWSPSRIHGQFLLYREVASTRNTQHSPLTTAETCTRFSTSGARPNTRLVPNGFAKRTITLTGSDTKRYRVISYFYPSDVAHLYGDPPEASVVFRHASDPRVVPANVSLCTPAQIPSIKQLITRVRKEYIDGSAVDGASVEMEQSLACIHMHTMNQYLEEGARVGD
ncbi:Gti1/Pac2 family-domain-containing protein [Chytriomyces cf. hyalinus JEL632]|nr:Gti1/Pac2 family-domain-containing protein [Chytriomyces cf. hyalinus JEL632]